jgi:hypothetical protein
MPLSPWRTALLCLVNLLRFTVWDRVKRGSLCCDYNSPTDNTTIRMLDWSIAKAYQLTACTLFLRCII